MAVRIACMSCCSSSPAPTPRKSMLTYRCRSAEDTAAKLCELEATCATLGTRMEQLMALNDELVADKGRLQAQVGACRCCEGWAAAHNNTWGARRWSWVTVPQTSLHSRCSPPRAQVQDLQLRAENAGVVIQSGKAQALARQLAERDAQLQALAKKHGELRWAGLMLAWLACCAAGAHLACQGLQGTPGKGARLSMRHWPPTVPRHHLPSLACTPAPAAAWRLSSCAPAARRRSWRPSGKSWPACGRSWPACGLK